MSFQQIQANSLYYIQWTANEFQVMRRAGFLAKQLKQLVGQLRKEEVESDWHNLLGPPFLSYGQSYRVLVIMIFFHYFETEEWCLLSLRLTIIYEETQITFICLRRCVRRAHINSLLCYFCTTLRSIHEGSVSDACSYRPEYTAFLYLIIGKISLRYESYDTQGGTCTTADLKCFTGDGNIQIYHRSF